MIYLHHISIVESSASGDVRAFKDTSSLAAFYVEASLVYVYYKAFEDSNVVIG